MKLYQKVKILESKQIGCDIFQMKLETTGIEVRAGQFIEMYVDNNVNLLPRPISICEATDNAIRIVFQTVGAGTKYFSELKEGEFVRIMAPLGNGFPLCKHENIAIVGGGVGVPPLLQLTKELHGKKTVFLGFRSQVFLADEFGENVYVATDDGSFGYHGNVVSLMKEIDLSFDCIYACGPRPMLESLAEYAADKNTPCYVSMEERMACGFGVCVGCAIKVKQGNDYIYKKVCVDGPVFDAKEVVWDD